MKLHLTKTEVMATLMPVEIETCTFDKDGKPLKLFVGHYVEDWLTLYAEVEAQTKLIEQLEEKLKEVGFQIKCKTKNPLVYVPNYYYLNEILDNIFSAVEAWRTGREQK